MKTLFIILIFIAPTLSANCAFPPCPLPGQSFYIAPQHYSYEVEQYQPQAYPLVIEPNSLDQQMHNLAATQYYQAEMLRLRHEESDRRFQDLLEAVQ